MDVLRIIAGSLLPWLVGIAVVASVRSRPADAPGEASWIAGAGYLAGAFLVTLWMRLLSMAGWPFGIGSIALPLLALAGGLWWRLSQPLRAHKLALRREVPRLFSPDAGSRTVTIFWWSMIAWMALRFVLLGIEIGLRPLYPWDAWMQWATKARVWYELGAMAPFLRAEDWFASGGGAYYDAAPGYPPTMPLLQVWSCLALGRWDDALMNWPWWQMGIALALVLYGGLRSLGLSAVLALTGALLVSTLPIANVHVALAGYADLPMAAYFTVAALALLRWLGSRKHQDAALAIAFALACTQIKNPGIVWVATLVPGVMIALMPKRGIRLVAIGFAAVAFVLVVLTRTAPVVMNYRLQLDFAPEWSALGQAYFLLGNWHLLWYGALAAVILAWRDLRRPELAPLTAIVAAGAFFLGFVFSFTNAREWVADQTTVNRATLHFAPLVIVFTLVLYDHLFRRWSAHGAETDARAQAAPPSTR